jgi:hypothetical protein
MRTQLRAHGVQHDVSGELVRMRLAYDELAAVPALEERSLASSVGVEPDTAAADITRV